MADNTYTDEMESWLGDGLPTDFEGTITNAKFAIPVDSQADDPQPMLICDIDNAEGFDMDEQRIGIGKGWVTQDKGARVEREDGGKLVFNKQSKIGRLLGSLMESTAFREGLQARAEETGRMVSPFEAEFWNGITGTWVREVSTFKNKDTGEDVEFSYWTVTDASVKTAGKKTSGPAKKAAAKKASASTGQTAKEKALAAKAAKEAKEKADEADDETSSSNGTGLDTSNPVIAQLVELAKAADDHDSFVIEAYTQLDEGDLTDDVTELIDNPDALYNGVS